MLKAADRIFNALFQRKPANLEAAKAQGDWHKTKSFLQKDPEWLIKEIIDSGLRGRGGAGFQTGLKWNFVPKKRIGQHYLIVNADESEPGTCKDREIITFEPHKLIEGALLAAHAIQAQTVYIYIRGEFIKEASILGKALEESLKAGLIGKNACGTKASINIHIHRGAGAYICGEESALLESLEGKKGFPRLKPPFPAQSGLYGCPTVINNVETLAVIPTILRRGANWFSSLGSPNNTGTKLYCLSGHVNNPCVVEEEMGVSLKTLIEKHGKGVVGGWNNLLAVIPGGSSVPMIPKDICEMVRMDYSDLEKHGTHLGTGGVMVFNKSVDLLKVIENFARFYMHESCGQCSPCREGTGWLYRILQRLREGHGSRLDLSTLESITYQLENHTICALGDAAAWPIQGLLRHFKPYFEARLQDG